MPTYEELIATLEQETTLPFSKVGIISSLVRLGDKRAIPHFIKALNDENHYVRRKAARALGELGSSEAMEPLLKLLENESDEETKRNALIALGNIGDEKALEPLKQAAKEPSYWIRRAAEMGLEQLQERLGIQKPVEEDSLKTSSVEESMNLKGMTSGLESTKDAEKAADIEDIPSYRELTDSISQENTVETSKTTIPETPSYETAASEYGAIRPSTAPRTSDERIVSPPRQPRDTWRCRRCGDEVDSYYDICQTCGGHREESEREETPKERISPEEDDEVSVEEDDDGLEEWFEEDFELNCPKCGETMLDGYLFTESDDALIFTYQEENDIIIGRGTQIAFICLNCQLISFPFREEGKK